MLEGIEVAGGAPRGRLGVGIEITRSGTPNRGRDKKSGQGVSPWPVWGYFSTDVLGGEEICTQIAEMEDLILFFNSAGGSFPEDDSEEDEEAGKNRAKGKNAELKAKNQGAEEV